MKARDQTPQVISQVGNVGGGGGVGGRGQPPAARLPVLTLMVGAPEKMEGTASSRR